jgi:hypothetical protein
MDLLLSASSDLSLSFELQPGKIPRRRSAKAGPKAGIYFPAARLRQLNPMLDIFFFTRNFYQPGLFFFFFFLG